MKGQTFHAERRQESGSARMRRLRRANKIPCVLYGHGEEVVPLALPADAIDDLLHGGHQVITLEYDGKQEPALIKEVQHDVWGREVLHVDFSRVSLDETVTVAVEIVGHGQPKAVLSGGVLEQPLHSVELDCKADEIPREIRVETGSLDIGEMIHVRDLELPEAARAITDPDAIVFVVHEARKAAEAVEEAPGEGAPAEPEVIGRAAESGAEEHKEEKIS